ncbi:YbbR-like domain-containing protein [Clostridioides difficile]|uniref:CdaR family protein n=1 Tax=Clostridioides difficile TaxID=1496 RepID=UPI000DED8E4F|nr:CdaR family protein [Clostridioides difficile]
MINRLKNNTKIKIISFLSAIALWMYVMAVVDPEETKGFEDIPVSISNMSDLKDKNLVIYPDEKLTADVYIKGSLSKVQSVKKEDIHVYGTIEDPIQGQKEVYLKANIPQGVTLEFKHDVLVVNLEKNIKEKRDIKVEVSGNSKRNINKIELSKEFVDVSGPRTLVKEVKSVRANLDVGNETDDFSKKLQLIPLNSDGTKVEGVTLSSSFVTAKIELLKEKIVPIRVSLNDNKDNDVLKNYKLSKEQVTIKGKKEDIDKINYIKTKPIDLADLANGEEKEVSLEIPEGITLEDSSITIKLNDTKQLSAEFLYNTGDIELRNIPTNMDNPNVISDVDIKVVVESTEDLSKLNKKDISLYIDLSQGPEEDSKYKIKYETTYQFKKINIEPNIVEVE